MSRTHAITIAALLAAATTAPALAQTYERIIGDPDEQRSEWVVSVHDASGNHGSAHAGFNYDGSDFDIYLARLKPDGTTLWDTRLGTPASFESASRIERSQTSDDGFLVSGNSSFFGSTGAVRYSIALTRLDANGNMLWSHAYAGDSGDVGLDVLSGQSLLCGQIQLQPFADRGAVVHSIDAFGVPIWGKYYADALAGPSTLNSFSDIHFVDEPDGSRSIVAVGSTIPALSSSDTLVVKLDMTGAVLWAYVYGPSNHSDFALGLEPAANGDLLVTGYSKESGEGGGAYVMRLTSNGTLLWWKDYRGIYPSNSIHEEPSGAIVIAGTTWDINSPIQDLALMQLDAFGNVNWVKRYGGQNSEYGEAVDLSPNGYVLSAWSRPANNVPFNLYALAADANGNTGCENDWSVVVIPRQHFYSGHLFEGHDLPDSFDLPFSQSWPNNPNTSFCDESTPFDPTCPSAWAPPYNVSDFSDVIAFLSAFSVNDPNAAALAPPLSLCDFSDVVAFLAGFGSPCP
ncbi:MAG: hypothetical protein R3B57_05345 [Phycisphaerales bacterium]